MTLELTFGPCVCACVCVCVPVCVCASFFLPFCPLPSPSIARMMLILAFAAWCAVVGVNTDLQNRQESAGLAVSLAQAGVSCCII